MGILAHADQVIPEMAPHWTRNQAITRTTLHEGFEIGESLQAGSDSGANSPLTFGHFDGALE